MVSQPIYWQYFIIDDLGRSYTVRNGIITATAQRIPLPQSPDGWQDISLIFQRDFTKGIGLNRSFALPFGFVRDGATILRKTFYNENIERRLYLVIQQLTLEIDETTFLWRYRYFTKQEFDFPKLKDAAYKVTVPLSQGGIQRLFDANRDTQYEIPFDRDSIIVKNDGLFLYETYNFLIPAINDSTTGFTHTTPGVPHHFIGIAFTTKDGNASGFAVESSFYEDIPSNPNDSADITIDWQNSLHYFFTATQDIDGVQIKGQLKVRSTVAGDVNYAAFLYKNDGTGITLCAGGITKNGFTTFEIDETINVKAGEKYFLIGSLGGYGEALQYEETRLTINLHSRYKATYSKAFKGLDLLKKLLAKMGIDPALCSSALLASVENILITCGNAIRGLQGSAIKTSLSEFLEFCRTEHAAGYGIEQGKLVIEGFAHFLNTAVIKPLGEAKDLEASYAEDLMANTVKAGYPNADIDNVNGKYEPNNTYLFSTPITKVVREHNLVCPYYAQPYLIETIRLNLDGKTTTDNASDNQTFLLNADLSNPISFHADALETRFGNTFLFTNAFDFYDAVDVGDTFTLEGSGANDKTFTIRNISVFGDGRILVHVDEPLTDQTLTAPLTIKLPVYPLYRPAFSAVEGVPVESQIFNISYLTPKEMVLRHMLYINSIMDGFAGQFLKYESTKNETAGLKTTFGGQVIEQKADVVIGNTKLFIPKQFDFENLVPVDLVEHMDDHPNSAFSVVDNGTTYILFYRTMGMAPNTMKEQSFKMLLAPNNNFQNRL